MNFDFKELIVSSLIQKSHIASGLKFWSLGITDRADLLLACTYANNELWVAWRRQYKTKLKEQAVNVCICKLSYTHTLFTLSTLFYILNDMHTSLLADIQAIVTDRLWSQKTFFHFLIFSGWTRNNEISLE